MTFALLFLVFWQPASFAGEEVSFEQLDPTDLLTAASRETFGDVYAKDTSGLSDGLEFYDLLWGGDTVSVNFVAKVDKELQQDNFAGTTDNRLLRQLWQADVTVPRSNQSKGDESELQRIIEQIRSVEFEPKEQPPQPVIVVEPAPQAEPNETAPAEAKEVESEMQGQKTASPTAEKDIYDSSTGKLSYEPLSSRTLQRVEDLSKQPEQLDNPFELAEVLFLSGHPKEAAIAYQQALDRRDVNDLNLARDRAWILFQMGNCLRNSDLETALKTYRLLIEEYPDSPWTDSAKVQGELIGWELRDKPLALIENSGL